jgi:hypothetical protein
MKSAVYTQKYQTYPYISMVRPASPTKRWQDRHELGYINPFVTLPLPLLYIDLVTLPKKHQRCA